MSLIIFLAIGALAGWIAGILMKGRSMGLILNMLFGVMGAFVGGSIFNALGVSAGDGLVGSIATATAGAAVILFVMGLFKR